MRLQIYSDTICPWCLIGKRRLERALAERPQEGLEITWHAFQLNPDMPREGMDRQRYLELKFAGPRAPAKSTDRSGKPAPRRASILPSRRSRGPPIP